LLFSSLLLLLLLLLFPTFLHEAQDYSRFVAFQ
jgi:hypothetical protein